jgi:hypothetical protein
MIFKSQTLFLISVIYSCLKIQKYEFYDISPEKDLSQFKGDHYILSLHFIHVSNINYKLNIDPCASLKCHLDEICVAKDDDKAVCIQRSQLEINENHSPNLLSKRDASKSIQYCGSNECRFGECEIRNMSSFVCHCFKVILINLYLPNKNKTNY